MTRDIATRHRRVLSLVRAAARLADPVASHASRLRADIARITGLSPPNVELCLQAHLETHPSPREIARLVASSPKVPHVHLLLSANVFVGALRALALAAAASPSISVRASRRDPSFVRDLVAAIDDPTLVNGIDFVDDVSVAPGEALHIYGRDETIRSVCRTIDPNALIHAHGNGIGFVAIGASASVPEAACALARDVVPFDQRGCLSPRIVLIEGSIDVARAFAAAVAEWLARWEQRVPVGRLDPNELADRTRYRDTVAVLGEVVQKAASVTGIGLDIHPLLLPPPGRNLHVVGCRDAARAIELLLPWRRFAAAIGTAGQHGDSFVASVLSAVPDARRSVLGSMQRPAFDGPVDLRHLLAASPASILARLA